MLSGVPFDDRGTGGPSRRRLASVPTMRRKGDPRGLIAMAGRRAGWIDARTDLPVLIVDDNPDTRMALSAVLGIRGYRTVEVTDGAQALDYLRSTDEGTALVLLDLHMPGCDGRAFLAQKIADPLLRDIPVVVYSAVDGHGLPADIPYVRKGTSTVDQLLDIIARAIRPTS